MSKSILILSPTPSHPQDRGNRQRIFSLVTNLIEMGHDVYFLFLKGREKYFDEEKMKQLWGDKYFSFDINEKRRDFFRILIRKFRNLFQINLNFLDSLYYSIDDWYDDSLDEYIIDIQNKISFDMVLVEYVFFSRSLNLFGEDVTKIIDTHDVFTNRHRLHQAKELNYNAYSWYSTTLKQEIKGLNRADVIITMQDDEKKFFQKFIDKKIISIGHLSKMNKPLNTRRNTNRILFIGSENIDNRLGIRYFLEYVFPIIRSKNKDVKFLLAGKICAFIENYPDCIKLGVLEDTEETYNQAAVVINPSYSGTGLAIKSIEALFYAKPLVTTSCGARGLEDGSNNAFLVANTPEEFAHCIVSVLEDEDLQRTLSMNAYNFAKRYNENNIKKLSQIFPSFILMILTLKLYFIIT